MELNDEGAVDEAHAQAGTRLPLLRYGQWQAKVLNYLDRSVD